MLNSQEKTGAAPAASHPPAADDLRNAILTTLEKIKGEDTVVIDLTDKSDVCSLMIISSGGSTTKVGAMAEEVRKTLKSLKAEIINVSGTRNKDWILIDANDCIIHLFRPPVREFYNLEKLWAPEISIERARTGEHPLEVSPEPELID